MKTLLDLISTTSQQAGDASLSQEEVAIVKLTLKVPSDVDLMLDEKRVVKIRLIRHIPIKEYPKDKNAKGFWQLTYADHSIEVRVINPGQVSACATALLQFNPLRELHDARMRPALAWQHQSMTDVYDANQRYTPHKNYLELHALLQAVIFSIVEQHAFSSVTVIDGGCGSGLFLKTLEREAPAKTQFDLIGFDFNSENIEECKKSYAGKIQFITKSLQQLTEVLPAQKTHPNFLVLSGSLTRLVLNNGFEALKISQQARRLNIDFIVGGGQAMPLINRFIAKRIGYLQFNNPDLTTKGNAFFCVRMPIQDILANKKHKIRTRQLLDLSLSAQPDEILKMLLEQGELKDGLHIDLSFAHLTPETVAQIAGLLKPFKVTIVAWHFGKKILAILKTTFPEADIKFTFNDWYLTATRHYFQALKPYMAAAEPQQDLTRFADEEVVAFIASQDMAHIKAWLATMPAKSLLESMLLLAIRYQSAAVIVALYQYDIQLLNLGSPMTAELHLAVIKQLVDDKLYEIAFHGFLLDLVKPIELKVLNNYWANLPAFFTRLIAENLTPVQMLLKCKAPYVDAWLIDKGLMPASERYKLFKPKALTLSKDIFARGKRCDIDTVAIHSRVKQGEIDLLVLHFTNPSSDISEACETNLKKEFDGINIFVDRENQTLTFQHSYDTLPHAGITFVNTKNILTNAQTFMEVQQNLSSLSLDADQIRENLTKLIKLRLIDSATKALIETHLSLTAVNDFTPSP